MNSQQPGKGTMTEKILESAPGLNRAPLTPLQRAYFVGRREDFAWHVHPHLTMEFDLPAIDHEGLTRAFQSLVDRHPMLRAQLLSSAELALPEKRPVVSVPHHNLSRLPSKEVASSLQSTRQRLERYDFALADPAMYLEHTVLPGCHRLHLVMDLLRLDGSSVQRLLRELSCLYQAPESVAPVDHKDLSPWNNSLNRRKSEGRFQRAWHYWMKRLDTLASEPLLPLSASAEHPQRSRLIRRRAAISAEDWRKLETRCHRQGVTPSVLLLTAYGLVVSYWAKYQEFVMTLMLQGQSAESGSLQDLVGNLARTLLVEMNFSERGSFREHLQAVQRRLFLDMTKSQVCGLEVLEARNRQEGAAARVASPVAFVSMLDEPDPGAMLQLENQAMVFSALETPQILLDHQAIRRGDGGVALIWDTQDSAFREGVTEDMFSAYVSLVKALIAKDASWDRQHFDWRNPLQKERHHHVNQVQAPVPQGCLHHYLFVSADRFPGHIALIDGETRISYAHLLEASCLLAWQLTEEHRVSPGDRVAVYLPKGWQQVAAVQGILTAGAAYIPVSPLLPESRKRAILERCDCRVVMTLASQQQDGCLGNLPVMAVDEFCDISSPGLLRQREPAPWPLRPGFPPAYQHQQDTAYIIFTSGSTGEPKGVVLDHRGPVNTIEDINRRLGMDHRQVMIALSDLNFDLSVYDIFGCLAVGATLVIPPQGAQREPDQCLALVRKHGVTVWNSVPALAQLLVEYLESQPSVSPLPLRQLMVSGDWVPIRLAERIRRFAPVKTLSLGGATEASIWSIQYPVEAIQPNWKSVPYGYPLNNQPMHVLDSRLQPRPDHVPGELYIAGTGLARGYWKDNEKTDKAFFHHDQLGERLYRTGDWGVRHPEGFIEFLGREDGQVKVRGYRIELGEIETVIQQHPAVENAVVRVIGEQPQDRFLTAYVVSREEQLPEKKILDYAARYLPEYMVPTQVVSLRQLPLSANGKVDRQRLPVPGRGRSKHQGGAAASATEVKLAGLWREVLQIPHVSRDDSFFALGGTSFNAVRLMAAISDHFGLELRVQLLMQHPQLSSLSEAIDQQLNDGENVSSQALVPLAGDPARQTLFWFHPSGGTVFCYRAIAEWLGSDFYSLGLQSTASTPLSLPEMARQYLREIRQHQPHGPYFLAGWSMGGVLAYHCAGELLAQGESISGLVLIDSSAPRPKPVAAETALISGFLSDLLEQPEGLQSELRGVEREENPLKAALFKLQSQGRLTEHTADSLREPFAVFRRNIEALNHYQGTYRLPPDLPCLKVMASDQPAHACVKDELWRTLLPGCTRGKTLAGNHYSLLKPPGMQQIALSIQQHWTADQDTAARQPRKRRQLQGGRHDDKNYPRT